MEAISAHTVELSMDFSQSFARRLHRPQPCKGAFNDPAARQNMKALGGIGALDDLDGPFAHAGERAAQFLSGISSIGKDMTQPREAAADRRQHADGAVRILDIGGMDENEDQKAAGVGDDMALAPLHFLAGIIATGAAAFRGFHALAIDHPGAWACLASLISRRFITNTALMLSNNPASRQA